MLCHRDAFSPSALVTDDVSHKCKLTWVLLSQMKCHGNANVMLSCFQHCSMCAYFQSPLSSSFCVCSVDSPKCEHSNPTHVCVGPQNCRILSDFCVLQLLWRCFNGGSRLMLGKTLWMLWMNFLSAWINFFACNLSGWGFVVQNLSQKQYWVEKRRFHLSRSRMARNCQDEVLEPIHGCCGTSAGHLRDISGTFESPSWDQKFILVETESILVILSYF